MIGLLQDLRYALRQLRRSVAFTVFAVLVTALGIGATTAMFSVIHAVLIEPLRYRDPEQIALLSNSVTPVRFEELKSASRSYSALGAMGLAALGIFSVIGYAVSQRTREIGVRIALGAKHWQVIRLVVRQGAVLAASGIAIGLVGAISLSRFLSSLRFETRWLLLFDVRPSNSAIYLAVPGFLGLLALAGSYLPARRAAEVDPVVAWRYE
jgi:FtsX-like permease family